MKPNKINVCFCFDKNLVQQVLITAWSCAENTSSEIVFHLIHTDDCINSLQDRIRQVQKNRIVKNLPELDFRLYAVDEQTVEQFPETNFSKLTCVRLIMHHILPKDITRLIYLDGDMLVTGDLAEIVDVNLGLYPVAAVEETYDMGSEKQRSHFKEIEFTGNKYFNAGMMVIDLIKFTQMKIGEKCVALLKQYPKAYCNPDQDTLNIVCTNQWVELDGRWNNVGLTHPKATEWSKLLGRTELRRDIPPGVLHFLGNQKPWYRNCYSQARFHYIKLAKALFPDFPIAPFPSPKTRLLMWIPVPMRKILKLLRTLYRSKFRCGK